MKKRIETIVVPAEHEVAMSLALHLAMQYLAEKEPIIAGTDNPANATFIWTWDRLAELRAAWIREGNESSGATLEVMAAASQIARIGA